MGHIQDRWWRDAKDDNGVPVLNAKGKPVRERTDLYGKGMRYKVRYNDLDGRELSQSFPDKQKKQAEDFLLEVESNKREGKYVDPHAGRIKFRRQAENWLKGQSPDRSTREILRSRLASQINPHFGDMSINSIKAATVRDWLGVLDERKLSQNYKTVLFTVVSSIMDSAVEDKLIYVNPCKGKSIKRPTSPESDIVVWPQDRLWKVRDSLAERFQVICSLGAGCGLRQGEVLGFSADDIDDDEQAINVVRQIRVVERTLVFSLPKGGKKRRVPLASEVLAAIRAHEQDYPAVEVTLPWAEPDGKPVTVRLLVTGTDGRLYTGDLFHKVVWQGAFRTGGLEYRNRADGMHALRHFYASTLLAQGVSIKELAEYLGHADPGFTLRTYTHLVPSSYERARLAIDSVFGPRSADGLEAA
jgi:integrase